MNDENFKRYVVENRAGIKKAARVGMIRERVASP